MERRKFEESFKRAFDGAEMEPSDKIWAGIEHELEKTEGSFKHAFIGAEIIPSDDVWTGIELELERADGEKIRRRLFFYKMLAAASITFAMCVAGIVYYIVDRKTSAFNEQLSAVTRQSQSPSNNSQVDASSNSNSTASANPGVEVAKEGAVVDQPFVRGESNQTRNGSANIASSEGRTVITSEAPSNSAKPFDSQLVTVSANEQSIGLVVSKNLDKHADRILPEFYSVHTPALVIPKNEVQKPEIDPLKILEWQLAEQEQKYASLDKKEKEKTSEKLWTSVGFAAGGFSSVNTGVSPASQSNVAAINNSSVADKQSKASGVSYSVGVNLGTRISKRWTIQGGVNYLTQSSDYIATNVVADNNFQTLKAESINELDKLPQLADAYASTKLQPTFPYSVNNNVKFFSVPVQAGYLLVNNKFGLQLNAGVSTDLFLENTITPEGGSLNKTTQGRGEESPYRSVNFSGLMGTEFSYRFGTHYRISLNPGLRYPLNSLYKSDVGIQSTPLTFDVGLRFRYIFH